MAEKSSQENYCAICRSNVVGGRSKSHAVMPKHLKMLIRKFRAIKKANMLL